MDSIERIVPVQITGGAYAASGTFRVAFDDVQPIAKGMTTYVRGVYLEEDATFGSDVDQAQPEDILRRVIDRLRVAQEGGHIFYDLPEQAGVALSKLLWAMTGRRQQAPNGGAGGAITVTGAADVAIRIKYWLPFYLPGSVEADDANIPLRDLKAVALEGTYANGALGGAFDAGADNTIVVSGTLRANVELVARDEYRKAVYFSIISEEMTGLEQRLTFLQRRRLHWLLEIPVHADGATENFVTDAERDLATLTVDDSTVVDRMDARDLNAKWNRVHAAARAEELPNHEGNASPWVALYCPGRRPYKITQLPLCRREPHLRLTGTDTTARLVHCSSALNDRANTIRHMEERGGDAVPSGFSAAPEEFLSSKSAKGADVEKPGSTQSLPVRLHRRRRGGA